MGIKCSTQRRNSVDDAEANAVGLPDIPAEYDRTGLMFLPFQERNEQMDVFLRQIQKHNLEIMKEEFKNDLHGFILNNLLLCVQFVENFDKSMERAKLFKFDLEKSLNEKLAPLATDGVILGERKCFLIHGMGHQLTKTYIYRDRDGKRSRNGSEYSGSAQSSMSHASRGVEENKNTFMCESILPLEFVITWDNLEIYKESEWEGLKEYQYSSAKGSPGINRFCMEEPDEKNKISKGYVRLRCVDTPLSLRPILPIPTIEMDKTAQDYDYSNASEFNDKIDEMRTESDYASTVFSDSDEFLDDFSSGPALLNAMRDRLQLGVARPQSQIPPPVPAASRDMLLTRAQNENYPNISPLPVKTTHGRGRRLSGELPHSYPTARKPDAIMPTSYMERKHESTLTPTYAAVVRKTDATATMPPTSTNYGIARTDNTDEQDVDVVRIPRVTLTHTSSGGSIKSDSTLDSESHAGKAPSLGESSRHDLNREGLTRQPIGSTFLKPPLTAYRRKVRPIQRQENTTNGDVNNNIQVHPSASSGYDSMPPNMGRSRSSSVGSEDIRQKWRQTEVKKLWLFPPRRRTRASEPLSEHCFRQVEYPIESETDEDDEDSKDSDSDSDDTDSDADSSTEKAVKKDQLEVRFEKRTYLDPLSYSSEFCSEFKQIGTQIGITGSSLNSAIVLGTTIRCAVEYPPGLSSDVMGNQQFSVLCTFTPSLNSKSWPQRRLLYWKQRMRKKAWAGTEKWPHEAQVEIIEQLGFNAIPLGYRSINLTQAENLLTQTLEWNVGFAQAENILLNSLHGVHWKCLTMSSLLFRAFIAPLGPLGLGLEHFRNILYYMCHEEFALWNDEQPGLHLRTLLHKVYECLGRGDMPSFFSEHNMLKNIPTENVRKVQAYLSKVRDNLVIYCMFAFRNLTRLGTNHYPMPNLIMLYKYLTHQNERDVLVWANPNLVGPSTADEDKKKKKKKGKNKHIDEALLLDGENVDAEYFDGTTNLKTFNRLDKTQKRLRTKRRRWEEKQQERKAEEDKKAEELNEKSKLPLERRTSIDFNEMPVKPIKFSPVRKALVLKYFIRHFVKMAKKSFQFEAYAQTAMYIQHMENLTEILDTIPAEAGGMDVEAFRNTAKNLRHMNRLHMHDYITAKIGNKDVEEVTHDDITGLTSISRAFSSNWDFRKLPTPPNSALRSPLAGPDRSPGVSRIPLMSSGMAKSLQSIPTTVETQEHEPSSPRRTPSIKFIDRPSFQNRNNNSSSTPSTSTPFQ